MVSNMSTWEMYFLAKTQRTIATSLLSNTTAYLASSVRRITPSSVYFRDKATETAAIRTAGAPPANTESYLTRKKHCAVTQLSADGFEELADFGGAEEDAGEQVDPAPRGDADQHRNDLPNFPNGFGRLTTGG